MTAIIAKHLIQEMLPQCLISVRLHVTYKIKLARRLKPSYLATVTVLWLA